MASQVKRQMMDPLHGELPQLASSTSSPVFDTSQQAGGAVTAAMYGGGGEPTCFWPSSGHSTPPHDLVRAAP